MTKRIAELLREVTELPLQTDRLAAVQREIVNAVADADMHHSIPARAAAAVVNGKLDHEELQEILDCIRRLRRSLNSPGAYFTACLKRAFQRNEIPWR